LLFFTKQNLYYLNPGCGKRTRVLAFLREIYGSGAERVKLEHRQFKTPSNKPIEITTLGSSFHIECNPSDVGNNDRFVIQQVIKEIASHGALQASGSGGKAFKVVVLTEVDRLSKQAQAGLRRTMEKYSSQCRIFIICNSASKVIEPVRSRCLGIRIPSPSYEEVADLLVSVAKKEQCSCEYDLAMKISIQSNRNIRRAILMLEAAKVQSLSPNLSNDLIVQLPDWEIYIIRLAREILQEQSPSKLLQAREMLYELLTNCIPADVIIETLTKELLKTMDDSLKHELVYWAAYYEHRASHSSKEIFHLEAFVAKFMAIYKNWLVAMFA
jgi:replication factor C subunit 3/5